MLNDRSEGLDETFPGRRSSDASSGPHPIRRRAAFRGARALTDARRLAVLARAFEQGLVFLQPTRAESNPCGYAFPLVEAAAGLEPGEGLAVLEELADAGFLTREVFGFALLCPQCGERTSEHVYLPPGERAPCSSCEHPFSFEDGALVRIHSYTPTALAKLAVERRTLSLPHGLALGEQAARTQPSPRARTPRPLGFGLNSRFRLNRR
jgi:hypothetical protein